MSSIVVSKYECGAMQEYYYVLLPTQVFTSDGRRPVKGERKSRLQNDFSPNRFHAQNQYLTKHPRLAVSAA